MKCAIHLGLVLLVLLAGVGAPLIGASAPVITRSPYLQLGTPRGVDIRWRTAQPSSSRVRYGSAPGALTGFTDNASQVTDHDVKLTGLLPDTRYFYSVGSTTVESEGNDSTHYFYTNPLPGTMRRMRFWVLGDSGTADVTAFATRDAYYASTGTLRTDAWLMLGDNAYSNGTDAEYQAAVFNVFQPTLRTSVLWPTIGNHDTAEHQFRPRACHISTFSRCRLKAKPAEFHPARTDIIRLITATFILFAWTP